MCKLENNMLQYCENQLAPDFSSIPHAQSLYMIKYRMRYAIYIPPDTKDLAINQTMVAYENRQNATAFARANNTDLLRSLKHLM